MGDALISVIIPVYNPLIERLSACLDSFEGISNVELVLINDGSNQSVSDYLTDYTFKHSNAVLYSQENAGVSASRNKGIEMATGAWISFCDADDRIIASEWEKASSELSESSGFYYFDYFKTKNGTSGKVCLNYAEDSLALIAMTLNEPNLYGTVWGKFFRRKIILDGNVRFSDAIKHAEDSVFLIEYLKQCKNVSYKNSAFYEYHVYGDSAAKNIENAVDDYLNSFEVMKTTVSDIEGLDPSAFFNYCAVNCLVILVNYIFKNENDRTSAKRNLGILLKHPLVKQALGAFDPNRMKRSTIIALKVLKTGSPFLCHMMVRVRKNMGT